MTDHCVSQASSEIISLNVGGTKFSTSYHTLTWIPDTFFTSLLSGRIPSTKDSEGNIFIDRNPVLFSQILNYLRTKEVNISLDGDFKALRHEADYFGITPLVRRLMLCDEFEDESCGGILFQAIIPPQYHPMTRDEVNKRLSLASTTDSCYDNAEPHSSSGGVVENVHQQVIQHRTLLNKGTAPISMSDLRCGKVPMKALADLHPMKVTTLKAHYNWLLVSYQHYVCLYRLKDSLGWVVNWISNHIDQAIDRVALNAKHPVQERHSRMVGVGCGGCLRLWQVFDNSNEQVTREIGTYSLGVPITSLFFIGSHLVALSTAGKLGVWHSNTQNWQVQDVVPITSHDVTGSLLLMGGSNGCIFVIDMQKFPLRMKDNDLLVTELFKDPSEDQITSLSIYSTPKTRFGSNWMEIAYGTRGGMVRVVVQHPETPGQDLQLFQSFSVHCSPVTKVMISEKHLVSVCSEYKHVRTWTVTRFRGMINTQPGSTPLSSFKLFSIQESIPLPYYHAANDFGPYGEKDDTQVFIQKVLPDTDRLFVRLSSTGKRVCIVKSVDASKVTSFTVHECESSSRVGSRPRRYLFTGHSNGCVQIWDLSTALELLGKGGGGGGADEQTDICPAAGLSNRELMALIDTSDLTISNTPIPTPLTTSLSNINNKLPPYLEHPNYTPSSSRYANHHPNNNNTSNNNSSSSNFNNNTKSNLTSNNNPTNSNSNNNNTYVINNCNNLKNIKANSDTGKK